MDLGPICRRVQKVLFILGSGSFALGVGSSCDPAVRDTVLSGFQGLATAFVDAFFLGLAANAADNTPATVN
mgnify:CR=1 FL=1